MLRHFFCDKRQNGAPSVPSALLSASKASFSSMVETSWSSYHTLQRDDLCLFHRPRENDSVILALRFVLIAQISLFITTPLSAQSSSGPQLLDLVRDAHQASRELIRNCSCHV